MGNGKQHQRVDLPVDEIVRLYKDEGLSSREIGERFDVSHQTILNRLHNAGVKTPSTWSGKIIDIPEQELERLYVERGLSSRQVARRYGCDPCTVLRRLKEMGIERRR